MNRIKELITANRNVVENFSYLSILQIFQLVLPLITYPYLISVVGKDLYGRVVFFQTIVAYFSVIINFGFDMYATKEVSISRHDKDKLSEILSSVYTIRLFLFIFIALGTFGSFFLFDINYEDKLLLIFAYLMCLGDVLFPIYYFQGNEKMKFITYLNLFSKLLFLCLIFLFVREENDYLYIALLFSIGSVLGGIGATYIVFSIDKIVFQIQPLFKLFSYMKNSSYYLVNSLSIALVERTNVILLGGFLSMTEVAYYDLAVKIIGIAKQPFLILGKVLYPVFSKNMNRHKVIRYMKLMFLLGIGGAIGIFVFGKYIIIILGGEEMLATIPVLRLLSVLLPLTTFAVMYGIILASKGYSKEFMIADIIYLIIYSLLVTLLFLFNILDVYSLSGAIILGVLGNTIYKYIKIKKYNILT